MDQENMAWENGGEYTAPDEIAADKQAQLAFAARDLEEFLARHADVDIARLMDNARFIRFCGSRMGKELLADLYDDFTSLIGDVGAAAAARLESRSARSTGGGTAGGMLLTPVQKYALEAWNAEHPEMAMTAKEFLGR